MCYNVFRCSFQQKQTKELGFCSEEYLTKLFQFQFSIMSIVTFLFHGMSQKNFKFLVNLKAENYFCEKAPAAMFDRVLNISSMIYHYNYLPERRQRININSSWSNWTDVTYSFPQGRYLGHLVFKGTHREKVPSNKIPALTKSTNMNIWVAVTSNKLFLRGS